MTRLKTFQKEEENGEDDLSSSESPNPHAEHDESGSLLSKVKDELKKSAKELGVDTLAKKAAELAKAKAKDAAKELGSDAEFKNNNEQPKVQFTKPGETSRWNRTAAVSLDPAYKDPTSENASQGCFACADKYAVDYKTFEVMRDWGQITGLLYGLVFPKVPSFTIGIGFIFILFNFDISLYIPNCPECMIGYHYLCIVGIVVLIIVLNAYGRALNDAFTNDDVIKAQRLKTQMRVTRLLQAYGSFSVLSFVVAVLFNLPSLCLSV
jgi:hypothetical protein